MRVVADQRDHRRASAELADAAAISRFHFHRVFKQITGATPRDYARTHRLGRLADKLETGQPVTEAIYAVGVRLELARL